MTTESRTSHTPPPWTMETVPTSVGICHKIGPFPGSCGRDIGHACIYVDGQHAPQARTGKEAELLANAVLMTAAPDLLAACEGILLDLGKAEWGTPEEAADLLHKIVDRNFPVIRNALLKAKGTAP